MTEKKINNNITRRDALKGLATVPLLGVFTYNFWKKKAIEKAKNKVIQLDLGLTLDKTSVIPKAVNKNSGEIVRIGIIGLGARGTQLLKALGFMFPDDYNNLYKKAKNNDKDAIKKLQTYQNQEMLNVQVIGICDVLICGQKKE